MLALLVLLVVDCQPSSAQANTGGQLPDYSRFLSKRVVGDEWTQVYLSHVPTPASLETKRAWRVVLLPILR